MEYLLCPPLWMGPPLSLHFLYRIQTLSHTLPTTPHLWHRSSEARRGWPSRRWDHRRGRNPQPTLSASQFRDPGQAARGALPVALSPLRGRTSAELRNRGLRALPLASALARGRRRGALFHLWCLPGIPSPPQDCSLLLLQASHGLCFPPTEEELGTVTSGPRRRCLPFQILQWGAQAFIPAAEMGLQCEPELPRLCASCQCIDKLVPSGVGHLGRAWSLPPLRSPRSPRRTGVTIPCDSHDVPTV